MPHKDSSWFVVVVILSLVIFALLWWLPGQAQGEQEPRYIIHTVESGEKLWNIAKKYRPGEDPRKVYTEIKKVNGKKDSDILPGEELKIPVGE